MSTNAILSDRDINTSAPQANGQDGKPAPKSMDFHRQVLQSKLKEDESKVQYVSPSDGIMSPCTQKLSNYRNKAFLKAKPQSLFAKTSSKNLGLAPFTSIRTEEAEDAVEAPEAQSADMTTPAE
ncbi:MAG: hypothetical protein M1829_001778 [Trizodia sp. TS-e1964]|nr:MAG: hypothetical protein M1829_001778 [Trizodia sp. TS-e1964]